MTPEQEALRDAVRSLLEKHSDVRAAIETPHGYDQDLWARLCDIGVLPIPEQYGGSGAGLAETHIALEELGRTLTPSPLLSSTIAAQALLATGNDEACGRLLPRIAEGLRTGRAILDFLRTRGLNRSRTSLNRAGAGSLSYGSRAR